MAKRAGMVGWGIQRWAHWLQLSRSPMAPMAPYACASSSRQRVQPCPPPLRFGGRGRGRGRGRPSHTWPHHVRHWWPRSIRSLPWDSASLLRTRASLPSSRRNGLVCSVAAIITACMLSCAISCLRPRPCFLLKWFVFSVAYLVVWTFAYAL